jgi:hypothetical protein
LLQVNALLERYIEEIQTLYATHQPKYQPKASPLEII